jgi:hypothetical protein
MTEEEQQVYFEHKELDNPIDSVLLPSGEENHKVLFEPSDDSMDLRTDLEEAQIIFLNTLKANDDFLEHSGLDRCHENIIQSIMRLYVSKDRKSRMEYVDVNRKENMDRNLSKLADFNVLKAKE